MACSIRTLRQGLSYRWYLKKRNLFFCFSFQSLVWNWVCVHYKKGSLTLWTHRQYSSRTQIGSSQWGYRLASYDVVWEWRWTVNFHRKKSLSQRSQHDCWQSQHYCALIPVWLMMSPRTQLDDTESSAVAFWLRRLALKCAISGSIPSRSSLEGWHGRLTKVWCWERLCVVDFAT